MCSTVAPIQSFFRLAIRRRSFRRSDVPDEELILQVCSLAEARGAARLGADVIVAQGSEAGGHGAARRTVFTLLPEIVDAVRPIPVLAAGGVSDGRGLAAALMLGAEGALVGTRLFASREALGSDALKQRILDATGDDTLRTEVFDIVRGLDWPPGYTGRAISNRFSRTWHGREVELSAELGTEEPRYRAARDFGRYRDRRSLCRRGLGPHS